MRYWKGFQTKKTIPDLVLEKSYNRNCRNGVKEERISPESVQTPGYVDSHGPSQNGPQNGPENQNFQIK